MEKIFLPTVAAMQAEGCPFKGCLYSVSYTHLDVYKRQVLWRYNPLYREPAVQTFLQRCITYLLFSFTMVFFASAKIGKAHV